MNQQYSNETQSLQSDSENEQSESLDTVADVVDYSDESVTEGHEDNEFAGHMSPMHTMKRKQDAAEEAGSSIKRNKFSKGYDMLVKMGFIDGKGLGINNQGIVEPVQASTQKDRRGLGHSIDELDKSALNFNPEEEAINTLETVNWLYNNDDEPDISYEELLSWRLIKHDGKKLNIEDEIEFCDPEVLADVLNSKSVFDKLGASEMAKARTRSNPFETIRSSIFLNRAAVKMANIDSLLDSMFTNPRDENNQPLVGKNELLYFADVCAGPGGFSEYILYRRQWYAKGFGFTLKGECDFKLYDFYAGHPESFDPYYGIKDDGNIFDPENIISLRDYIMSQTDNKGVHFMMADGGFSVEGQNNVQEILSKQLYLCQCLVAVLILRPQGHFVVKLFDLFTPFSAGLLYLMHRCFKSISIIKPNTSRPANSERYLVCKWKLPNARIQTIVDYMIHINGFIWENDRTNSGNDIIEIVPTDLLKSKDDFYEYLRDSNNELGRHQIVGLRKIAAYCKDKNLIERRQEEFRVKCLEQWKLPIHFRTKEAKLSVDEIYNKIIRQGIDENRLKQSEMDLTLPLKNTFIVHHDWYFVPINIDSSTEHRGLFLSRGGFDIYIYRKNWQKIEQKDPPIELPPNTLVYGEIVKELTGEGQSQIQRQAFHIIDGIQLDHEYIAHLPHHERNRKCQLFASSIDKSMNPSRSCAAIRCKKFFELAKFEEFFQNLTMRRMKANRDKLVYWLKDDIYYAPQGILFFNNKKASLNRHVSTRTGCCYFSCKFGTRETFYDNHVPPNNYMGRFDCAYVQRRLWKWEFVDQVNCVFDEAQELKIRENIGTGTVTRTDFVKYLNSSINPTASLSAES